MTDIHVPPATPAIVGRQVYNLDLKKLVAPPPKLFSRSGYPKRPVQWSPQKWEKWLKSELEKTGKEQEEESEEEDKEEEEAGKIYFKAFSEFYKKLALFS